MNKWAPLHQIFYDTKTGYTGLKALTISAKEENLSLTPSEIKQWYDAQEVNQIFNFGKNKSNIPFSNKYPGRIMADLIDMSLLARKNSGYKWILSVIDVQTRYCWAFPTKKKNPDEILAHLKGIQNTKSKGVDERPWEITTLTVDDGGEFKASVKKWAKDSDIKMFIANPKQNTKTRTALVEAFNRNLLRRLYKYMQNVNDYTWIDVLPDFVDGVNKGRALDKIFEPAKQTELVDDLRIGDYVRILKERTIFDKVSRVPKWSTEVYRILTRDHARYVLIDSQSNMMKLAYLPRQLQGIIQVDAHGLNASRFTPLDTADDQFMEQFNRRVVPHQRDTDNHPRREYITLKEEKQFVKKQASSGLDIDKDTGEILILKSVAPKTPAKRVIKKLHKLNL